MPELPEVETIRRGLAARITGLTVTDVVVRKTGLRWPVPKNLPKLLRGKSILALKRRAKYLLVEFEHGTLILHLGMSGSLRVLPAGTPPEKHDHFDLVLTKSSPARAEPVEAHESADPSTSSGRTDFKHHPIEPSEDRVILRLRDPRRFGAVLWHSGEVHTHPLLAPLGPEPLEDAFNSRYLYQATRGRSASIKQCLMNNRIVVGVGNIYANEALYRAGIRPQFAAGKLSLVRCAKLVEAIRATLTEAIEKGGSTLRDFVDASGQAGYAQQHYFVYGRAGEKCRTCGAPIKHIRQGQRSSFYCGHCQK